MSGKDISEERQRTRRKKMMMMMISEILAEQMGERKWIKRSDTSHQNDHFIVSVSLDESNDHSDYFPPS